MRRSRFLFLLLAAALLHGCGRGAPSVRIADAVPLTADAIERLLLGRPEEEIVTSTSPQDAPLLKQGVHERVVIAVDTDGFHQLSRGALTRKDLDELQGRVVEQVNRRLKRKGFSAEGSNYPPVVTAPRTLTALLTPHTEETGSAEDKARGRGRKMVLIRLTISDPATNTMLAQREYYSGADVQRGGRQK